jgi:ferredoxin-NADP reductase
MAESSTAPLPVVAATRLSNWLTHLGISPLAFDDTLSLINPLLTVHRLNARIVERRVETGTAVTLVLQAGPAFRGLRPGQFVMIGIAIQGVRHRRAYSPRTVAGHPNRFAITVQRQPGGLVSNHLNEHVRVGDFIEIEQAAGDFTLPSPVPTEVLLIAGGSGITPSMAMLEHLQEVAPKTRATLIYFARSRDDRIFAKQLEKMAANWSGLQYVPIDSVANTPSDGSGRVSQGMGGQGAQQVLDAELLNRIVPRWTRVPAYCCGPAPLMDAARTLWQQAGAQASLHLEAFAPAKPSGDPHARHAVRIVRDAQARTFEAPGDLTLLVAGETAGLSIKHGCRQGICHECTCRLNHGSVMDLTSGQRIDGEGQPIRLCVSSAMSDLDLESLN